MAAKTRRGMAGDSAKFVARGVSCAPPRRRCQDGAMEQEQQRNGLDLKGKIEPGLVESVFQGEPQKYHEAPAVNSAGQ